MAQWTHRVEVTIPSTPHEAAQALAEALALLPEPFRSLTQGCDSLDDMIEWLRDLDASAVADDFDELLRLVYDWADAHRLWLYLTYEGEKAVAL